jgi:hypothetical protein
MPSSAEPYANFYWSRSFSTSHSHAFRWTLFPQQVDSIGDAYIVIALGDADAPPSPEARHQLLSAALAMRAAVRRFDAAAAAAHAVGGLNGDGGHGDGHGRLRLRIGVAEGGVISGVTGAHRQRFQCLGHALVLAERLQRAAAPDEIRVHPAAAAAAGEHFRFAPAGPDAKVGGVALLAEDAEVQSGGGGGGQADCSGGTREALGTWSPPRIGAQLR